MSTLEALGVAKRYRLREVVKDLSVSIESGQVVGLLGPNGAGKTTAFYMIVGLVSCDRGSIRLNGRDITRLPVHRRARLGLGYLPQEASVFRKLSVADNIRAILETRKDLDRVTRRRVEIARALAAEPKFVLLDEPFAGVDPISVLDIQRIIRHLAQRDIGVLITDHNVRETLGICGHAYILNDGALMAEGSPDEILSNKSVREVYLGEGFSL
jgi:lipopolysaccharide export system ATP-binding protein